MFQSSGRHKQPPGLVSLNQCSEYTFGFTIKTDRFDSIAGTPDHGCDWWYQCHLIPVVAMVFTRVFAFNRVTWRYVRTGIPMGSFLARFLGSYFSLADVLGNCTRSQIKRRQGEYCHGRFILQQSLPSADPPHPIVFVGSMLIPKFQQLKVSFGGKSCT